MADAACEVDAARGRGYTGDMLGKLLTAVGILALAGPARAAAPYAEDAAAVAAFFASSVTLTTAKVAVHDVDGPGSVAGPAAFALRAALLKLGVAVVRPEAGPDYDVRGLISADNAKKVWLNSLWQRSDGRMLAAYDRTLGDPHPAASLVKTADRIPDPQVIASDVGAADDAPVRRWRASLGANIQERGVSPMLGGFFASRTGKWEAGLEFAKSADRRVVYFQPVGPNQPAQAHHSIDVWQLRAKASALTAAGAYGFLHGWVPRKWILRATGGLALVHTRDTVSVSGPTVIPPLEGLRTHTNYLNPIGELGFRIPASQRFHIDAGVEWMPTIVGPDNFNFGGFATNARILF